MTAFEYRLVATQVDGRLKRWPKRNLQHAQKGLADLLRDIEQRPHCGYRKPVWLEQRTVGNWFAVASQVTTVTR